MNEFYPSEGIQKRLRDQYVPENKLDVISLLDLLPGFILKPQRPFKTYNLKIEKTDVAYTLSYVNDEGAVWYSLSDKRFTEAVGRLFAYLLENEDGDYWVTMPDNPKVKTFGKKKG